MRRLLYENPLTTFSTVNLRPNTFRQGHRARGSREREEGGRYSRSTAYSILQYICLFTTQDASPSERVSSGLFPLLNTELPFGKVTDMKEKKKTDVKYEGQGEETHGL